MALQTLILILTLLALLTGILLMLLTRSQKKNKKYIRKEVRYYVLAALLLFGLMGFLALSDQHQLRYLFWMTQALMLGAGILHAWLMYTLFLWPSRSKFGPETLLTVIVTSAAAIGFVGGYWLVDRFLNTTEDGSLDVLAKALLWVPVPYFILRTYDYMTLIPERLYEAWRFPAGDAPEMEVIDYLEIYVGLTLQFNQEPYKEILAKIPRQESIERFFHRFVHLHNQKHPQSQIQDIKTTPAGDALGWVFYIKPSERSRRQYILPQERGAASLREGELLFAERVKIDPTYQPEPPPVAPLRPSPKPPEADRNDSDSDITITEK